MYRKVISPNYEQVGKRQRLTGFLGEVFDGETRVSCFEYRSYSEAEIQTDLLVYEILNSDLVYSASQLDGAQADDDNDPPEEGPSDDIDQPIDRPRASPMWAESPHAPSLSQAIAIGLVGDPDPTCEHCGAAAFVWCDSHMYCRSWWHTGECQPVAVLA